MKPYHLPRIITHTHTQMFIDEMSELSAAVDFFLVAFVAAAAADILIANVKPRRRLFHRRRLHLVAPPIEGKLA